MKPLMLTFPLLASLILVAPFNSAFAQNDPTMAQGTEASHDEFIDRIGAPPLLTDAPDAADEGVKKITLWFNSDRASDGSSVTELPHVGYSMGIGYHTEIGIDAPLVQNKNADGSSTRGLGKQSVGFKTTVYENQQNGIAAGFAGSVITDVPFSNSSNKGVTEPGNHVAAKFLVSKQFGPVITVANVGYDHFLNPPADAVNPDTISSSVAAGIRYNPRTAFMAEVAQTNAAKGFNQDVTRVVNLGVIHKYNKNITVFASVGKSLGATADGKTHTYVLTGLSYEWEGDGDGRARLRKHHLWKSNEDSSDTGESAN